MEPLPHTLGGNPDNMGMYIWFYKNYDNSTAQSRHHELYAYLERYGGHGEFPMQEKALVNSYHLNDSCKFDNIMFYLP